MFHATAWAGSSHSPAGRRSCARPPAIVLHCTRSWEAANDMEGDGSEDAPGQDFQVRARALAGRADSAHWRRAAPTAPAGGAGAGGGWGGGWGSVRGWGQAQGQQCSSVGPALGQGAARRTLPGRKLGNSARRRAACTSAQCGRPLSAADSSVPQAALSPWPRRCCRRQPPALAPSRVASTPAACRLPNPPCRPAVPLLAMQALVELHKEGCCQPWRLIHLATVARARSSSSGCPSLLAPPAAAAGSSCARLPTRPLRRCACM